MAKRIKAITHTSFGPADGGKNQPILLDNEAKYKQRLKYLHENPVRAGFVSTPEHWVYSSAVDYCGLGKGLLDLSVLE